MFFRTEAIHLRQGGQQLSIEHEIEGGMIRYVGSIDGSRCVTSITREGALSALLRRHICRTIQAGNVA